MGGDKWRRLLVGEMGKVCNQLHRLRLLQQGTEISEKERRELRAHLLNPCEQCLLFLEGSGGRAVLLAVAGQAAHLTQDESEAMFSAALRRGQTAPEGEAPKGILQLEKLRDRNGRTKEDIAAAKPRAARDANDRLERAFEAGSGPRLHAPGLPEESGRTDQLYTTHDVSRLLQVDPSTVSKWIDRGVLLAFRTPGGHRRVRGADLRSFLIAHQMPLPDELGSALVNILVVDDEKTVLDAMRRSFKSHANVVDLTTTSSGVEALLLVSELKPHGMLIDLHMPDMDGFEVCRHIRARTSLEGVRLVTMTGRFSPELAERSLKVGALACLPKPVEVRTLLELFRVPRAPGKQAAAWRRM
jgi:excisionase family DNA binding protein